MKGLNHIILLLLWHGALIGQYTVNESALIGAKVHSVEDINTKDLEFSPLPFKDGILYVSPEKKRNKYDRNIDEGYFRLRHIKKDISNSLLDLSQINSNSEHIGPATFDANNRKLYYTSSKKGKKGKRKAINQIEVAQLNGAQLVPAEQSIFENADYSIQHPSISLNGQTMIVSANRYDSKGGFDLYSTTLSDTGWTEPTPILGDVNSTGHEAFPFLWRDSILLFASNGRGTLGGFDLYASIKEGDKWSERINLGKTINSAGDDLGLTLDQMDHGYFSSNRAGGKGKDDIYELSFNGDLFLHIQPEEELIIAAQSEIYDISVNVVSTDKVPVQDALVSLIPINDIKNIASESLQLQSVDSIDGSQRILMNVIPKENEIRTENSSDLGHAEFTISTERRYFINVQDEDFENFNLLLNGSDRIREIELELIPKEKEPPPPPIKKIDIATLKKLFVFDQLYYKYGSSDISDNSQEQLNRLIQFLKEYPNSSVELIGHTDSRGNGDFNLKLSLERAESVKQMIIDTGVASYRISAKGMGEREIRNHCSNGVYCTEGEHEYNRRTEIKVIYPN